MKKEEIIVFGGNGLVGSEMTFGTRVGRNDCDLLNYNDVYTFLKNNKPKYVINCAGKVGGIMANVLGGMKFFEDNLIMNLNVIKACMELKIENLISFSSTCVYPSHLGIKSSQGSGLKESDLHNGEPHPSNYPYAYAKRMVEVMTRIANQEGFNFKCLIPTNIYGINDNFNLKSSHLVPALIHKAHLKSSDTDNPRNLLVWGDGSAIREFIYAHDVSRIVKEIIFDDKYNLPENQFTTLNLSSGISFSITELAETLVNIFSLDGITYDRSYPNGQPIKAVDIGKFRKLFPNFEFTPIHNGLLETVRAFIVNYEKNKARI